MPNFPKQPANDEDTDKDTSEKDQKTRPYYYDDAHGYEVFKPDDQEEDDNGEAAGFEER